MVEQALRGTPMREIAAELQCSPDTVTREIKRAASTGLVEQVRDRLITTLAGAPEVYQEILTADVEYLSKHSKGYALKKQVVDTMATGLGVYKTETAKTVTNTLEVVAAEQAPAEDKYGFPVRPRVRFEPETIEAEVVSAPTPAAE